MTLSKRHLAKSLTWRIIGTVDTFLISFILTGSLSFGLSISGFDFFFKLVLYYFHERIWFITNIKNVNKRHLFKTFSWRVLAFLTTIIIAWIITNDPFAGIRIGIVETLTKMILYYSHEKIWYKLNFGLTNRTSKHAD